MPTAMVTFSGIICPVNICTYQQYLSCYWSHFDITFRTNIFGGLNFCWKKCVFDQTSFGPNTFWTNHFFKQIFLFTWSFLSHGVLSFVYNYFWTNLLLAKIFVRPNLLFVLNFLELDVWSQFFFAPQTLFGFKFLFFGAHFLWSTLLLDQNFLNITFF